MSFATVANLLTAILCAAVLVQSVRMMRSLKAVRGGAIREVVDALDRSTGQARLVLGELKQALAECGGAAQAVGDARAIADELTVMVGIANASADRMAEAANGARRHPGEERGGWA